MNFSLFQMGFGQSEAKENIADFLQGNSDATVEEVMDLDSMIDQLKVSNEHLVKFFDYENLMKVLQYALVEWENSNDTNEGYKYPYIACQILTVQRCQSLLAKFFPLKSDIDLDEEEEYEVQDSPVEEEDIELQDLDDMNKQEDEEEKLKHEIEDNEENTDGNGENEEKEENEDNKEGKDIEETKGKENESVNEVSTEVSEKPAENRLDYKTKEEIEEEKIEKIWEQYKLNALNLKVKYFSFLDTDEKLNPVLSGYFARIFNHWLVSQTHSMLQEVYWTSSRIPNLLKHFYDCSIAECLSNLISLNESQVKIPIYTKQRENMIQDLVNMIAESDDEEVHLNVVLIIKEALDKGPALNGPQIILQKMVSKDVIGVLLKNIDTEKPLQTKTSTTLLRLISNFVRQNHVKKVNSENEDEDQDDEPKRMGIVEDDRFVELDLKDFFSELKNEMGNILAYLNSTPKNNKTFKTQYGKQLTTCGMEKVDLVYLLRNIVVMESQTQQVIEDIFTQNPLISTLLDLWRNNQYNNILLVQIRLIFDTALLSKNKNLLVNLLGDGSSKGLIPMVLEFQSNKTFKFPSGNTAVFNTASVTKLANQILKVLEDEEIKKGLLENSNWDSFVEVELKELNEQETRKLAGKDPADLKNMHAENRNNLQNQKLKQLLLQIKIMQAKKLIEKKRLEALIANNKDKEDTPVGEGDEDFDNAVEVYVEKTDEKNNVEEDFAEYEDDDDWDIEKKDKLNMSPGKDGKDGDYKINIINYDEEENDEDKDDVDFQKRSPENEEDGVNLNIKINSLIDGYLSVLAKAQNKAIRDWKSQDEEINAKVIEDQKEFTNNNYWGEQDMGDINDIDLEDLLS